MKYMYMNFFGVMVTASQDWSTQSSEIQEQWTHSSYSEENIFYSEVYKIGIHLMHL
jgi:hypothetical protein